MSSLFSTISTTGKEIKTKDVQIQGKYPVISQSKNDIDGYSNIEEFVINKPEIVLFGDHTRVVKYIKKPFIAGADGTKILNPLCNGKYLYYACLFASTEIENRGYGRHFAMLKNVLIPDYSYEMQLKIVDILDKEFGLLNRI